MSLHYDGACQSFTFPFFVSAMSTHTLTTDRKQELAKYCKAYIRFCPHYANALTVDIGGMLITCLW